MRSPAKSKTFVGLFFLASSCSLFDSVPPFVESDLDVGFDASLDAKLDSGRQDTSLKEDSAGVDTSRKIDVADQGDSGLVVNSWKFDVSVSNSGRLTVIDATVPVFLPTEIPDTFTANQILAVDNAGERLPHYVESWSTNQRLIWVKTTLPDDDSTTFEVRIDPSTTIPSTFDTFSHAIGTWLFSDGEDASGNLHSIDVSGFESFAGMDGAYMHLDGTSFTSFELGSALSIDGPLTVVARVRPTDILVDGPQALVSRGRIDSDDDVFLGTVGGPWRGILEGADGADLNVRSVNTVPENEWVTVALRFGASTTQLYVDGMLIDSVEGARSATVGQRIAIGANSNDGDATFNENFIGDVHDIRLFDRTLDESHIEWLDRMWDPNSVTISNVSETVVE